ncbi:MAG: lysophospholipid acyltransferase family protein [Acidobacteria bacterium]|nr:lysophospholipid acyltransferase family protein [Acidobacteriota bacterium]
MNEPSWQGSRLKRAQVAAIAAVGYPLIALLGRTFRWRVGGYQHYDAVVAAGRQPILCLWHGRILPGTVFLKRRGIVVITSQNFDGEWIARIIQRFGFGTARGSSSRNAAGALRQMVREMRAGHPTAITVDGPRGPAGVAKAGAVWLAMASGCPLVPFHIEAERFWTLRSWDRAQIPKPFSRVAFVVGEPLEVPRELDEAGIDVYRQQLETRLAALRDRARALVSGEA